MSSIRWQSAAQNRERNDLTSSRPSETIKGRTGPALDLSRALAPFQGTSVREDGIEAQGRFSGRFAVVLSGNSDGIESVSSNCQGGS